MVEFKLQQNQQENMKATHDCHILNTILLHLIINHELLCNIYISTMYYLIYVRLQNSEKLYSSTNRCILIHVSLLFFSVIQLIKMQSVNINIQ